jgi:ABC-2 type transport system permease protein
VLSFSFHFEAITGEKQARVTEVILSAVHPQDWMDGKIAGITATALATVLCYASLGTVSAIAARAAGVPVPMIGGSVNPGRVAMFLTLALLALVVWNCFFAAIAAMINEPTSSSRGTLMSFPITSGSSPCPSWLSRHSYREDHECIPLTSYVVLPVRLVMSDVAWWEFPFAVAMLLAAIWVLRRMAGRIFSAGMMMTGKQLTPTDAWRWLRGATA